MTKWILYFLFGLLCQSCGNQKSISDNDQWGKDIKFDREIMSINPDGGGRVEGYWAESENEKDEFPFPKSHANPFPGKNNFVEELRKIQNNNSTNVDNFKGHSFCRFGDEPVNGSAEFSIGNGDNKVSWPQGYLHYIIKHNVIPSREFYNFVMNYKN